MSDTMTASAPEALASGGSPLGDFVWYELMTPNPEGAKAFYEPVVGWSMTTGHGETNDYGFITRSDGGMTGGVLRMTQGMAGHGVKPAWLGHIGVNDVDTAVRAIEADGGKGLMPAQDIEGAGRIAMVTDPQGATFYVMKPKPPEGQERMESTSFSVDRPQHIRWNELASSDPDAAIAFYTRHFGWSQEGEMDMGEMGKYRFVQHQGVGIGAVMPMMPGMPASVWTFYIGVDDIDRAKRAVEDGGGSIQQGPMEIPGGEYSLNATDPQGAVFGLVGPRKA